MAELFLAKGVAAAFLHRALITGCDRGGGNKKLITASIVIPEKLVFFCE
jgi:hypothetical protein